MLQRTKGRILLALLVITGMAGTTKNTTLSAEERKFCVGQLKKSRAELIGSLKELSPQQLSFRSSPDNSNIGEHIYHLATAEKALDDQFQQAMKTPAVLERPLTSYSDFQLLELISTTTHDLLPETAGTYDAARPSFTLALESFKSSRANQVKYIRNTTENLRNHTVRLAIGHIDCYQLLLVMFSHSDYHLRQIREIMNHHNFPSL